jgi:pimeloyl-ACP methyl ester carboxylesterase
VTEFVSTNDLQIGFEVSGPVDGASVVAVHGWPDSPRTWDAALPHLHERGCRVYRPYLRGFGPTRFREDDAPRSGQIAALCRDLRGFIDALRLDHFVLAGHDWGARAAYAMCATSPGGVRGLVAMSVGYGGTGPEASISPEQAHAYWYQWFFSTEIGRRILAEEGRDLCRYLWQMWAPSLEFDEEEFDATAAAWENPDWVEVTAHSYSQRWGEAEGNPELEALERRLAENPAIEVPTIVLHGLDDGATLPSATENQKSSFPSRYERRVLTGVGHFVPREAPSEVAAAILDQI